MRFDTKIAIVVREDLASWQKLNVTAYLASAIAAGRAGVIGEPYEDGSGRTYLAMFGQPVLVFSATGEELATVHRRAMERELPLAIFTEELFKTGNDADNRAAVAAVPTEELRLVGLGLHARRATADKVVRGLRLHQ
jgi:hypothetical protein